MIDAKFDVTGIGNALVDIFVNEDDSFLINHGIQKGIMTLVEKEVVENLHSATPDAKRISGGSSANTVIGISSFGGRTAYIGKIQDDILGDVFSIDIRRMDVFFEANTHKKKAFRKNKNSTGCSYIIITPDAQRTMLTYLGAASDIKESDIKEDILANSKITYLEGYLWDTLTAKKAMKKAMDIAHDANRKVSFSLSDPFCVNRHREEFQKLVRYDVDILFANESEILSLYQENNLEDAIRRVRNQCEITVITKGEFGSVIVTKDDEINIHPVVHGTVLDTTGAGDLYAAGFLYGYCNNKPLDVCGRFGSIAAGEIISHLGARPKIKLDNLI